MEEIERFTQEQLAERYGLSIGAINYILNGYASTFNAESTSKPDHRKKVEAADVVAEWRLNPDATQQAVADKLEISRQNGHISTFSIESTSKPDHRKQQSTLENSKVDLPTTITGKDGTSVNKN